MNAHSARVIAEIEQRIMMELESTARRIALVLERRVVEALEEGGKVVSGDLKKSIASDVEKESSRIIIKIFAGMGYAQAVHDGSRPHTPPIFDIARWVQKKGIGQKFTAAGRMMGSKRKKYTKEVGSTTISSKFSREVLSVAYAIRAKIAKRGTREYKFFDIALKRAESDIQRELDAAAKRIAA